jgi:hypothetical protein
MIGDLVLVVVPAPGLQVVPREDVRSDFGGIGGPPVMAFGGQVYPAHLNGCSAVCAVLPDGAKLGMKPGEFDFVCPFLEHAETVLPRGAQQPDGHPWRVVGEVPAGPVTIDGAPMRLSRVHVGASGWRLEFMAIPAESRR